jgi:hypothetical protein
MAPSVVGEESPVEGESLLLGESPLGPSDVVTSGPPPSVGEVLLLLLQPASKRVEVEIARSVKRFKFFMVSSSLAPGVAGCSG